MSVQSRCLRDTEGGRDAPVQILHLNYLLVFI